MSDPNFTGDGVQGGGMWSPQDLVGTTLADRYQVQRVIGDGGMGSVYEAQHITLRKRVALKVLHPELCRDQTHVDRFLQEARAASMIEHDNIVDIVDFGPVPGGSVFFAMEYLEGTDLAGVVKNEGRLSWPRVQKLMIQIVSALAAAHKKKIIHRDLKPANCFMIDKRGREHIKLLDFGIAKVTDENADKGLTRTGAVFGTAKYMAPEQACGEVADNRTDIYAAAVVMYELLTGHVPFDGDNFMRVLSRHLTEPLTLPSTMAPDAQIPPTVESIVVKALSKKREDRYQSMEEFAQALEAIGPDGNLRADLMLQGPGAAPHQQMQGQPMMNGPGNTLWMGGPAGSQGPASQPPEGRGGTVLLDSSAAPSGQIPVGRTEFAPSGISGGTAMLDGMPAGGDPITGHPPGSGPAFGNRPISQPPPGAMPGTTPPSPETRPPTRNPDNTAGPADYTDFSEKKSKAGFFALVIGGAIAAIGGGGLVAWLLLGDTDDTAPTEVAKVERDHPEVPDPPAAEPEPELEPVEPKIPEPEPEPKTPEPKPEPATPKPEPKPEPATPKPDPKKPGPKAPVSQRSDKDIGRGFAKAKKAAKECGSRHGALPGQVVTVEAGIGKSGKVASATAIKPNTSTPLGKCVAKAIKDRAKFPKSTQLLETKKYSVKM